MRLDLVIKEEIAPMAPTDRITTMRGTIRSLTKIEVLLDFGVAVVNFFVFIIISSFVLK